MDNYGLNRYLWERLEDETSNNYDAIVTYRDRGRRRTLRKATCMYYDIEQADFEPADIDPMGGKIRTIGKWL